MFAHFDRVFIIVSSLKINQISSILSIKLLLWRWTSITHQWQSLFFSSLFIDNFERELNGNSCLYSDLILSKTSAPQANCRETDQNIWMFETKTVDIFFWRVLYLKFNVYWSLCKWVGWQKMDTVSWYQKVISGSSFRRGARLCPSLVILKISPRSWRYIKDSKKSLKVWCA